MLSRPHRRDLLRAAAGGAVGAALPLAACGPAGGSVLPTTQLAEDMVVITAAAGNVLAARGPDGVVMVDGGADADGAAVLATAASAFKRAPVQTLFNTHWHREQTGCNLALGQQGARIVAHENTKQWLAHEIYVRWQDKTYEPLPDAALPTETFYSTASMPFGDSTIEYGHMLMAHTDGDIYVFFPKQNVLVAGGAVSNDAWPIVDWWTGGWIGGVLDGFETMLQVTNDDTTVVPCAGPLMTKADLQAQYEMYNGVFDRLLAALKSSQSPAEAVAARPTEGLKPEWGDPDLFVELAFHSFYGHLRGDRRVGTMP